MGECLAVCALAAALEQVLSDERASDAFRSVCALAMTLAIVRGLMGMG